ncbi:MAG TPA: ATP-binding protein [Humisphaera sp.]|jgi:two-component system sensor histidine kinase QseC|nr:ATP-binding protein [Humisphaera sp.]
MKSIRRHLTITLLAAVLALVVAADALVYLFAQSRLLVEFDRALTAKAHMVMGMVGEDRAGHLEFDSGDADLSDFGAGRTSDYFQVLRADGSSFARSPSLGSNDLQHPSQGQRAFDIHLLDGQMGRAIEIHFKAHSDEDEEKDSRTAAQAQPNAYIVLARSRRDLDGTLRVLGGSLLVAALIIAAGTIAAVTFSVRRGLGPLYRLGREVDGIAADTLAHRFDARGVPSELRPIYDRLNGLLERLNKAFARERRFTSDVAHELRTPVAELRALAEVALKWPDPSAAPQNFRDALNIAHHMDGMISTLLSIARQNAGVLAAQLEPVELSSSLNQAWEAHAKLAASRNLIVEWTMAPDLWVQANRSMLAGMLENLLANAVTYTPAGGTIIGRVAREGDRIRFSLTNTCENLSPDDLPHLFEPFWRKDTARTGGVNCGLGLSLVKVYAAAMNAAIDADMPDSSHVCFTLSFVPALANTARASENTWKNSQVTADKYS